MERLAEGFVALDLRGRVTYLTDRAVRLLGRRRAELLGAEPWDVLPWLSYPVYENAYIAAVVSRQPTGFAARYRPATHALDVGGDLYDLIDFGADVAAAVIGDVQGHSVRAAALMGQIRTAVHSHARTGAPPEDVLARTNRLLVELKSDLFCSCLYAHVDVPGSRVLLASAGHPPPVLRRSAGHTEVLDLPPGLLLGVEEEARFQTVEVPLRPGAVLALYTDGLVERPGTDLRVSIDLLADRIARADDEPLDVLADTIVEDAERTAASRCSDDMALLLVRCGTDSGTEFDSKPGTKPGTTSAEGRADQVR